MMTLEQLVGNILKHIQDEDMIAFVKSDSFEEAYNLSKRDDSRTKAKVAKIEEALRRLEVDPQSDAEKNKLNFNLKKIKELNLPGYSGASKSSTVTPSIGESTIKSVSETVSDEPTIDGNLDYSELFETYLRNFLDKYLIYERSTASYISQENISEEIILKAKNFVFKEIKSIPANETEAAEEKKVVEVIVKAIQSYFESLFVVVPKVLTSLPTKTPWIAIGNAPAIFNKVVLAALRKDKKIQELTEFCQVFNLAGLENFPSIALEAGQYSSIVSVSKEQMEEVLNDQIGEDAVKETKEAYANEPRGVLLEALFTKAFATPSGYFNTVYTDIYTAFEQEVNERYKKLYSKPDNREKLDYLKVVKLLIDNIATSLKPPISLTEIAKEEIIFSPELKLLDEATLRNSNTLPYFSDGVKKKIKEKIRELVTPSSEDISNLAKYTIGGLKLPEQKTEVAVEAFVRSPKISISIPKVSSDTNMELLIRIGNLKMVSNKSIVEIDGVKYVPYAIDFAARRGLSEADRFLSDQILERNSLSSLTNPSEWSTIDKIKSSAETLIRSKNTYYIQLCQILAKLRNRRDSIISFNTNKLTNTYNPKVGLDENGEDREKKRIIRGEIPATFTAENSFKKSVFSLANPFYYKLAAINRIEDLWKKYSQSDDPELEERFKSFIESNSEKINKLIELGPKTKAQSSGDSQKDFYSDIEKLLDPIFFEYQIEQKNTSASKLVLREQLESLKERLSLWEVKEDNVEGKRKNLVNQEAIKVIDNYLQEYLEGSLAYNNETIDDFNEYFSKSLANVVTEEEKQDLSERLELDLLDRSLGLNMDLDNPSNDIKKLVEADWDKWQSDISEGNLVNLPEWLQKYLALPLTRSEISEIIDNADQYGIKKETAQVATINSFPLKKKQEIKLKRVQKAIETANFNKVTSNLERALNKLSADPDAFVTELEKGYNKRIVEIGKELSHSDVSGTYKDKLEAERKSFNEKIKDLKNKQVLLKEQVSQFAGESDKVDQFIEYLESPEKILSEENLKDKAEVFKALKEYFMDISNTTEEENIKKFTQYWKDKEQNKQAFQNVAKELPDENFAVELKSIFDNLQNVSSTSLRFPIMFENDSSSPETKNIEIPYFDKMAKLGLKTGYESTIDLNLLKQQKDLKSTDVTSSSRLESQYYIFKKFNEKYKRKFEETYASATNPKELINSVLSKVITEVETESGKIPRSGQIEVPIELSKSRLIDFFDDDSIRQMLTKEFEKYMPGQDVSSAELSQLLGLSRFEELIADQVKTNVRNSSVYNGDISSRSTPIFLKKENLADDNKESIVDRNKVKIFKVKDTAVNSRAAAYFIKLNKIRAEEAFRGDAEASKKLPLKSFSKVSETERESITAFLNSLIKRKKEDLENKLTESYENLAKKLGMKEYSAPSDKYDFDSYKKALGVDRKKWGSSEVAKEVSKINNFIQILTKPEFDKFDSVVRVLKDLYPAEYEEERKKHGVVDPGYSSYAIPIESLKPEYRDVARMQSIIEFLINNKTFKDSQLASLQKLIRDSFSAPEKAPSIEPNRIKDITLKELHDLIGSDINYDYGKFYTGLSDLLNESSSELQPQVRIFSDLLSEKNRLNLLKYDENEFVKSLVREKGAEKVSGAIPIWVEDSWKNTNDSFKRTIILKENFDQ